MSDARIVSKFVPCTLWPGFSRDLFLISLTYSAGYGPSMHKKGGSRSSSHSHSLLSLFPPRSHITWFVFSSLLYSLSFNTDDRRVLAASSLQFFTALHRTTTSAFDISSHASINHSVATPHSIQCTSSNQPNKSNDRRVWRVLSTHLVQWA